MSKQAVRDEIELLQTHEEHAKSLTNLVRDGRIDLDLSAHDEECEDILTGLDILTVVLDHAIQNRNQQVKQDTDPRHERYPYEH